MSILYDKVELLEFFDKERLIDAETEEVEYILERDDSFRFTFTIMPYDEFVSVSLYYRLWHAPIFDVGIHNINRIELDRKKQDYVFLSFFKEGEENPVFTVMLNPTIAIQYSITAEVKIYE
jgi:hypothetical protein